jgi:hypothetical protein
VGKDKIAGLSAVDTHSTWAASLRVVIGHNSGSSSSQEPAVPLEKYDDESCTSAIVRELISLCNSVLPIN